MLKLLYLFIIGVCHGILERRIVDGNYFKTFPWMVYLRSANYFCGGTLYTESLVISAAHCNRYTVKEWRAYVNVRNIEQQNLNKVIPHKVIKRFSHPDYSAISLNFDISVWWISGRSNTRTSVVLDSGLEVNNIKDNVIILGWGNIVRMSPEERKFKTKKVIIDPNLKGAEIPIVQNALCSLRYKNIFNSYSMFCTGNETSGSGASMGDSGGPVVRMRGSKVILVGVISFCDACGFENYYDVHAKISTDMVTKFINHYAPHFKPQNLNPNGGIKVLVPPFTSRTIIPPTLGRPVPIIRFRTRI